MKSSQKGEAKNLKEYGEKISGRGEKERTMQTVLQHTRREKNVTKDAEEPGSFPSTFSKPPPTEKD